jgi:flavodoxin I
MQDDWEEFIDTVVDADPKGKKIALFGLGDQEVYSDSFVDGLAKIYKRLKGKFDIVGSWPTEGYLFDDSDAVVNGKFVGLVLDEDNQIGLTDKRINEWVKQLKKDFK